MRVTVTIDTDGAAFDNGGGGDWGHEVRRILHTAGDILSAMESQDVEANGKLVNLRDINGNSVGEVTLTDDV